MNLLEVENLHTHFFTDEGVVKAVNGLDFTLRKGETLGILGESGSGKSVTSLSIMRLIQRPGRIVSGSIRLNGEDLVKASDARMRQIRGNEISMIFQEPMTALNPVYTIGNQLSESFMVHRGLSKQEAMERSVEMLQTVGIPEAHKRVSEYPHRLSGGMRQRVMIAMALSCNPKLLIADEPTTALDVTIQAQILDLMMKLKSDFGTAIMLITHDMAVVAETAERVLVMYAGQIVEEAPVIELFRNAQHPYTMGLLGCIPKLNEERDRLYTIPGGVPNLMALPPGCAFANRCTHATDICKEKEPQLQWLNDRHRVRCWLSEGEVSA
jgi:oligopeptide/dipeptide ABC transporter ATP-binding protein